MFKAVRPAGSLKGALTEDLSRSRGGFEDRDVELAVAMAGLLLRGSQLSSSLVSPCLTPRWTRVPRELV